MAADILRVCAYTQCCLTSYLHNSEVLRAPTENSRLNVCDECLDLRETYWRQAPSHLETGVRHLYTQALRYA